MNHISSDAKIEFHVRKDGNGFTKEFLELPEFYREALRTQKVVKIGDVKCKVCGIETYSSANDAASGIERFAVHFELEWFGFPSFDE